jgi:hypothetical protein
VVSNTNETSALDHANSGCAASGLNDLDQSAWQTVSQVQTAADSWKYSGLRKSAPATLGPCRGRKPGSDELGGRPSVVAWANRPATQVASTANSVAPPTAPAILTRMQLRALAERAIPKVDGYLHTIRLIDSAQRS